MIWWLLLIFGVGMVLILAEFIVPGGILGVIGVLLLLLSGGLGIYYYPDYTVFIIVGETLGAVICVILGMMLLAQSGVARFLKLETSLNADEGYTNQPDEVQLMGKTGTVLTQLRPAGIVEVEGIRIDAVSDGTFIEQGATVRVVEVHGNRIVVEALDEA